MKKGEKVHTTYNEHSITSFKKIMIEGLSMCFMYQLI